MSRVTLARRLAEKIAAVRPGGGAVVSGRPDEHAARPDRLPVIRCLGCERRYVEAPPEWTCPACGGPVSQLMGTLHVASP